MSFFESHNPKFDVPVVIRVFSGRQVLQVPEYPAQWPVYCVVLYVFWSAKPVGALCHKTGKLSSHDSPTIDDLNFRLFRVSGRYLLHTSAVRHDLMEFFEDPKNWGEMEVKVGRAWTIDELRIKSNTDLHKLWYILLKERNMLLTMEHECNDKMETFPNPERIDKVDISMENLEAVVRERNRAYHLLETGEIGEAQSETVINAFGLEEVRHQKEHLIPKEEQPEVEEPHVDLKIKQEFMKKYREKELNERRKEKNRNRNHVMRLLQRFPNTDLKVLAEHYPDVDIQKLIDTDQIRGHYSPNSKS